MNAITNLINRLGPGRFAAIGGTLLSILAFLVYLGLRASNPDMALLFAQLDPADGGRILERLKALNIPHEVKGDGGSLIYVPTEDVAKIRMELAQDGLPAGGNIGYEIFDKSDVLGTTSAMLNINHMRALEGELAKSIRTIQGVAGARVHLVMPKRELFSQTRQEPSASVVLKMSGSSKLSSSQAQSIQHLVASAIPGLLIDKITIIDDKGSLLTRGKDFSNAGSGSSEEDQRLMSEERMARTIEGLLEKTLGTGKVRSEVSLEMDFDKITTTSVEFNPEGQVARSVTSAQEQSNANEGSDAASIQNALPEEGEGGSGNNTQTSRSEENNTYEISNSTKTHVKEVGTVKRISVAVLVDGVYTKSDDGKENYAPRPEEEINQIAELVKTAVGYKEDRGDIVKIVNMRFSEADRYVDEAEMAWYEKLNINKIIELVLLGAFALLVGLFVVRPIISVLIGGARGTGYAGAAYIPGGAPGSGGGALPIQGPGGQMAFREEDYEVTYTTNEDGEEVPEYIPKKGVKSMINIDNIDGRVQGSSIKKIGEIVEKHPEEAVSILRSWMYAEK